MDKIILITLLAVSNILWYAISDSQAKDIKGYDYAVNYIISHPEDGRLLLCIQDLSFLMNEGFFEYVKDYK